MKYGFVENVGTCDTGGYYVNVSVDFMVNRSYLYEFMDCLMPVDDSALREPIEAILEHSCEEVVPR